MSSPRAARSSICITSAIVLTAGTCGNAEEAARAAPEAAEADTPVSAEAAFPTINGLQRALISAMADPQQDPTSYVAIENFTLIDGSHRSVPANRDLTGRPIMGQDFFRFVHRTLTPAHRTITQVEIFAQRGGTIVAITSHEGVDATITAWQRVGEEWKAVRMTVNAPASTVNAFRAHFSAGAPRARPQS